MCPQGEEMPDYRERDAILETTLIESYEKYLRSDLWATIRRQVLYVDGRRQTCRYCPEPARQVHHQRYTPGNLLGWDLSGLVAVCGACHKRIEFNGKKKRTGRRVEIQERRMEKRRQKREAAAHRCIATGCKARQEPGAQHCARCLGEIHRLALAQRRDAWS